MYVCELSKVAAAPVSISMQTVHLNKQSRNSLDGMAEIMAALLTSIKCHMMSELEPSDILNVFGLFT